MRWVVAGRAVLVFMDAARERVREVIDGVEQARGAHRYDEGEQAHDRNQKCDRATSSWRGGTGWNSSKGTHERSMK